MTLVSRVFASATLALAILYIFAAVSPSHYNWGIHHAAFISPVAGLICLGVTLALLAPQVRRGCLAFLSGLAGKGSSVPTPMIFILVTGVAVLLTALLPAKLQLLGDSDLILELTPRLPSIEDVSANFRNQPLTYEILRFVQWVIGSGDAVEVAALYRTADLLAGVLFLGIVLFFVTRLNLAPLDRLLIGFLLVFRPGTQFFFGYAENYMFFFTGLTAYMATGWLALEGKISRIVPAVVVLLLPALHVVGVVFLPTALFLWNPSWYAHRKPILIGGAVVVIALVAGWFALDAGTKLSAALEHNILPLTSPPGGIPYGVFSAMHLLDWTNANLHIAPFSLLVVVAGLIMLPRVGSQAESSGSASRPLFIFLASASAIGLLVTIVIHPGLGMARDWDMLSNFFTPLRFLMAWFLVRFLADRPARHGVLILAVASMLQWGIWIGLNANQESHLARAEVLTAPELSGSFPKIYYESLGKTFYNRKDYAGAVRWYERYVTIDSTNPRILGNLSDAYRGLGDEANKVRTLKLSVASNSKNPGVYSNLGVAYINSGDTTMGMQMLLKAVELDPGYASAHANLSQLYLEQEKYPEAAAHAKLAISLGLRSPALFKNGGYAALAMGNEAEGIQMLRAYVAMAPGDRNVEAYLASVDRRAGGNPKQSQKQLQN